ncbi:MAG: tetratricopeptide repeat protein [Cytophagales bacterium]|nr:tetratricopeptide repeat protein [Cytophagales bacterium]
MEKIILYSIGTLICLLLPSSTITAQNFALLQEKVAGIKETDPKAAITLIESAINENNYSYGERAELFYSIGDINHSFLGEVEKALLSFYNALRFFRLANNSLREHQTLVYLAILFQESNHYKYAIEYYTDAINIPGLDSAKIRYALYNLADAYRLDKQHQKALDILLDLDDYYTSVGKTKWLLLCKSNIGHTYFRDEQYEASKNAYNEVLAIIDTTSDYRNLGSKSINSLGILQLRLGNFSQSEELLLQGLELKRQKNASNHSLIVSYINLGQLYIKTSKPNIAVNYFTLASDLDPNSVNYEYFFEALNELTNIAKSNDNKDLVIEYKDRIIELQKPLVAKSKRLEIFHDQYIAERAKYLHEKITLKDQLITSQNRSILGGTFLIGLLIIVLIFFVIQNRKLRDQNDLMPSLRMKDKLLNYIKSTYGINLEVAEEALRKKGRQAPD